MLKKFSSHVQRGEHIGTLGFSEDSVKKGAGDNDAQRAALQAEEQDRP